MVENRTLRVFVVGGPWYWHEAVLRVLERAGGFAPVEALPADVAVVDLDDVGTAAVLADLRDHQIPALAVGAGAGRSDVVAALNASASYAARSELNPERLVQLVRVAASEDALFVQASRRALEGLAQRATDPASQYGLTQRELDVLRGVAAGLTNAEIGRELHLAPSSVKKLVSRCLVRLGVRNRVEAALVARRDGIASSGDDERACA